jgi:hypothetical protein
MKPVTRTRLLLLAMFIFPVVVMALFWRSSSRLPAIANARSFRA